MFDGDEVGTFYDDDPYDNDLEGYELRALARDAEIDRYHDWYRTVSEDRMNQPMKDLISWKQFEWTCWYHGEAEKVVSANDTLYMFECDNIGDREIIDRNVKEYNESQVEHPWARQYERDCWVCLMKVPVVDSYDEHWKRYDENHLVEVLACGHKQQYETGAHI